MVFFSTIRQLHLSGIAIFLVVASSVIFHIVTISKGQEWGGDYALYLAHAINIISGHSYTDTGFIYNPNEPFLSPRSYPPVYPLFLSPFYAIFGLNLYAMQVANVLFFAAFLVVFYRYSRNRLESRISQIAVVAAVAYSPWFWLAKDRILPDFVFLLLTFYAIVLMERIAIPGKLNWHRVFQACAVGITAYLAYGTRSLGLAILPALILSDMFRFRLVSRSTLIAAGIFVGLYLAQNTMLHTDQSYVDSIVSKSESATTASGVQQVSPAQSIDVVGLSSKFIRTAKFNLKFYHELMVSYWAHEISVFIQRATYITTGLLAIAGFLMLITRLPSIGDFFLLTYGAAILLLPFLQGERYLLPIMPLYILYVFRGAEVAGSRLHGLVKKLRISPASAMAIGITAMIALSYLTSYYSRGFQDFTTGVGTRETQEMLAFIRESTPEGSIIVFRKPRPIALFTGRRSVRYHWTRNIEELQEYFISIGVTHFITVEDGVGVPREKPYSEWFERYAIGDEPVFANDHFRVYRFPGSS